MELRAVVVMGASAGGVEALKRIVANLPGDLPAAVCIVLHIPSTQPSRLREVLSPVSRLPVLSADDGMPLQAGRIVVARPDRHLMVDRGRLRVTRGPKESRMRPAVDVLFRSAAAAYGPQVIGVVLSGGLDDGTAGLWAIKDRGGVALVQDPATADFPSMPESARAQVDVDAAVPLDRIASEIERRVRSMPLPVAPPADVPERMQVENLIAREGNGLQAGSLALGTKTAYTCPECHGALVEIVEGRVVRFRCHTGHAYSIRSLLTDVDEAIDRSLWDALRAAEERILLLRRIAETSAAAGAEPKEILGRISATHAQANALRQILMDGLASDDPTLED